jgi:hypothetical protein
VSGDGYFDERVAARYDESSSEMFAREAVEPAVDFLARSQATAGRWSSGSGPAASRSRSPGAGWRCTGSTSRGRWSRGCARSSGGEAIPVAIGDFATTRVDGAFSLAYLVFNTINNLTTQAEQVACFRNVAAHLEPGGRFVIEVGVPELRRLPPGETMHVFDASEGHWGIDEYDLVNQGLVSHHFSVVDGAIERVSMPFRYVWPSELDLMAELAGMRLRERWSGWKREPFTGESRKHVSVWETPAS